MEVEELLKILASRNLKQVHRDTKIPYDRMFKWTKGKGRPKVDDLKILEEYFLGENNSNKMEQIRESGRKEFSEDDVERIVSRVLNADQLDTRELSEKDKLIKLLENNLIDKDSIIQKSEQLIKEKERIIEMLEERILEYQKKISYSSKEMGSQGSSKPRKHSNT